MRQFTRTDMTKWMWSLCTFSVRSATRGGKEEALSESAKCLINSGLKRAMRDSLIGAG